MNLLFLTQSSSLDLFYNLNLVIRRNEGSKGQTGYYVTDSAFFQRFLKEKPDLQSHAILKEWEILKEAHSGQYDLNSLKHYEKEYGDPFLWDALVADRRIYMGKKATTEQDYTRRYSDDEMFSILYTCINRMEQLFDTLKPSAVVGFICVTIGEYVAYLIAKNRNIPFINLRPTRIKNYFFGGESVHEPSERFSQKYYNLLKKALPPSKNMEIEQYLAGLRKTHAMYEGVIPSSSKSLINFTVQDNRTKIEKLAWIFMEFFSYNFSEFKFDNHFKGTLYPRLYARVKRPLRLKWIHGYLKSRYTDLNELGAIDFAFYPLHKEPEVTLLVYGKAFLNQIEVIRNLSHSLPMGMKLLVKEHPAGIGYRSLSYYKKLLSIPNVFMVPSHVSSRDIITRAKLIAIVSGSIGLEAIMMKKPVIHFGNVPFSWLPDTMIKKSENPLNLKWDIAWLLKNYKYNNKALKTYIAAVMDESVPIDFYSKLLKRTAVYTTNPTDNAHEHYLRLATYIVKIISKQTSHREK